jgi:hypothetical protein
MKILKNLLRPIEVYLEAKSSIFLDVATKKFVELSPTSLYKDFPNKNRNIRPQPLVFLKFFGASF